MPFMHNQWFVYIFALAWEKIVANLCRKVEEQENILLRDLSFFSSIFTFCYKYTSIFLRHYSALCQVEYVVKQYHIVSIYENRAAA
jgi:hypothetical protein